MPAPKYTETDPVAVAVDLRRGVVKRADLSSEMQQAVRRVERFSEGKIAGHAAKSRERPRTFLPATRTRSARLE